MEQTQGFVGSGEGKVNLHHTKDICGTVKYKHIVSPEHCTLLILGSFSPSLPPHQGNTGRNEGRWEKNGFLQVAF